MLDLNEAIKNVELTNENVASIAKQISEGYTTRVDTIIGQVTSNVNNLNNDQLRALITDLSFSSFSLGEAKEYAELKGEIAEALTKETLATEFNTAEGTVDARRNKATLNSQNEQLTEMLFETVAGLLKVKLDEVHRIVDTLKTVIMTRNTEAKIAAGVNDVREGM